jgi:hypothetical protein
LTDQTTASGPAAPEDATWAPSTAGKLVNFGVFQIVWFVCVYGAAEGNPWVGPLSAAVLLPINLRFTPHRGAELRLWALAGLVGLLLDTALRTVGWVAFPAAGGGSVGALLLAPAWIVTLWVAFGSLLTSSLTWLNRRPVLAVLLSAIGGPFSFWSGTKIGATSVPGGWVGYLALSIEYALVVPCLMLAGRTLLRAAIGPAQPTPQDTTPRPDRTDSPTVTGMNDHDPRR